MTLFFLIYDNSLVKIENWRFSRKLRAETKKSHEKIVTPFNFTFKYQITGKSVHK